MDVITATIVVCEEGWVTQASQAFAVSKSLLVLRHKIDKWLIRRSDAP